MDYQINSREQIKINGIIFTQDPATREDINARKVLDSMDRILRMWSTRHLTLLGRILIIKTFAVSQLIYLAQSIALSEKSCKAAIRIIFKYLWNKHYDGNRAPERIKRTIMLTPIEWGGFGLIDLNELCDSLNIRSYARLINSKHPFLMQLVPLINASNFFDVKIEVPVDRKFLRSLELLNKDRIKMLRWPTQNLTSDAGLCSVLMNTKLKILLTRAGGQSLNYFVIHQRGAHRCTGQVTIREFESVSRYLIHQELVPVIKEFLTRGQQVSVRPRASYELYPMARDQAVVNISGISSKSFRINNRNLDNIICLYKQGLVLTPGEVLCWTKRIKGLTSTRHKNIMLRIVHGDIFSNARLHRFGLIDNSKCANCSNTLETINHRLLECEKALKAWETLERYKSRLGLNPMQSINLVEALGVSDYIGKIELALNAELLHKLAAVGGKSYCPTEIVKSVVKTIANGEKLNQDKQNKFREVINSH